MLIDIRQKDEGLLPVIQKYGCLFLCYAHASPNVYEGDKGIEELNDMWKTFVKKCYIGRTVWDSREEEPSTILSHTCIVRDFGLPYMYDGMHRAPDSAIPDSVALVIGEYYYKGSHFVILNKNKEVIFDSVGKSNTVANGYLKSMRWFYAN